MALTTFEKNLELLSYTYPFLYERIINISASAVSNYDQKGIALEDQVEERTTITTGADITNGEFFVVYGFGTNPHFLEELLNKNSSAFILVIESSLIFFIEILMRYPLEKIVTNDRVKISVEESPSIAVKRNLEEYFGVITVSSFTTIKNSSSLQINPEYYNAVDELLKEVEKSALLNQETIKRFSREWTQNIFLNLKTFAAYPGVNILFDQFKGIPAIVVSAGPSLDKNIKWLKHIEGKAVLIAVDSAYKVLLSEKINVNFVLCLDSQIKNYFHLEGTDHFSVNTILVMNPVVFPGTPESFKGKILNISSNIPLIKLLEIYVGEKGEPLVGGSVSTAAFDFARKIGCNPVILMGQDLSYPGKRAYVSDSFFSKCFEYETERNRPLDYINTTYISSRANCSIDNFFGLPVPTSYEMTSWKEWFQNIIGQEESVNATEGGMDIKGFNFISFGNAARIYCKNHHPIEEICRKSLSAFKTPDIDCIFGKLKEFLVEFKQIKQKTAEGKQTSLKLIQNFEKKMVLFKDYASDFKRLEVLASELLEYKDFIEINQWEINSLLKTISSLLHDSYSPETGQSYINKTKIYYELFKEIGRINEFSISVVEKGVKCLS